MALTYGFYNSIEGDRVYDAIQFGRIFDGIIKDGVYATYEKGMMVIASANPAEVIIQPGRAWFNHTWSYNDANVIFEAPAPEVLLERYDALVLEINEELSSRENSFKWVTGTPSSRPERPTLTNTTTIHQYPLCYVHRYPETTMIYTRDITNMIGTSECPFATGVLEGIDLDAWINQWDDEFHNWENSKKTQFEAWMLSQETAFTTWYNAFKDQMASDVQEVEDFVDYLKSVLDASTAIHLQEEIDDLRNEISSGSHITVTTINPELYGRNVTITEAGGTVFTEKFDNTGVAVFKSVPYVGNLTISSTYGTQTAERVVNTPYYARYEFAIAFWAATVNIVGDPEMSGSTVTIKDSNETVVGTVVLDNLGTGIYTAIKPDTYKFILTYGGQTMEVTLSVTQETTYTVDLHADRFKWENWVDASKTLHSTDYDSLDEVLADEKAVRELMTIHACVDYLANIDDEDEDVKTIIENDLAAKWINLRDYALDTLYANTVIKEYMDNSLAELKPQVPTMTSNTTPYGTASASLRADIAYKAFDGDSSTYWTADTVTLPQTIYYEFPESIKISAFAYQGYSSNNAAKDVAIVDANGNELETFTLQNTGDEQFIKLNGTYTGGKFGLKIKTTYNGVGASAKELQFYAYEYSSKYFLGEWALMPQVPTMTSNTAPYGEAFANQTLDSAHPAYYLFDNNSGTLCTGTSAGSLMNLLVGYKFNEPVCVKGVSVNVGIIYYDKFVVKVSNDGSTWETIGDEFTITKTNGQTFTIDNDEPYLYVAINPTHITSGASSNYFDTNALQFYAYAPKGNVPIMTANNAPYGEAIYSDVYGSGVEAYRAFDDNPSTFWAPADGTADDFIGYKSINPICVRRWHYYTVDPLANIKARVSSFKLMGSNDNSTWNLIDEVATSEMTSNTIDRAVVNDNYYIYHKVVLIKSHSYGIGCNSLQFYGRELSVSVPTMTGNTTPYGEASSSSAGYYPAYKAFDRINNADNAWRVDNNTESYLLYNFKKAIVARCFEFANPDDWGNQRVSNFDIIASNDGTNFTVIRSFSNIPSATIYKEPLDNDVPYKYYGIKAKGANNTYNSSFRCSILQFYGLDYSEQEFEEGTTKKWLYDHGVELTTFVYDGVSGGATNVTSNDGQAIFINNATNVLAGGVHCQENLANFNLFRAKVGDITSASNYTYGEYAIGIDATTPTFTWAQMDAVSSFLGNSASNPNAPNNISLDISAINTTVYLIATGGDANSASGYNKHKFTELWLE